MVRVRSLRLLLIVVLSLTAVTGAVVSAQRTAEAMVMAGQQFVESLTAQQRQQALFPFESDERLKWNYIPDEAFPRNGLSLKAMTPAQRMRAHDLLKAGLSQKGYMTYTAIMELETVLRDIEKEAAGKSAPQFVRDPLLPRFSVFGTPSADGTWGWRVDGHHISLHFTVIKGRLVSNAPTFAGTNPAEVKTGKQKGLRILAEQEDTAREFLMSLSAEQQATAIFTKDAPEDIVTGNKDKVDPLDPVGIKSGDITPELRLKLMNVIRSYTSLMADDIAKQRLDRIWSAGINNVYFGWAGGTQPGEKHYYRVQGPTFLIEFDNTQNDANHIHSVWRDFNGDFGRDLLREHVQNTTH
jgi:Protein of unknown function (DUF3500)